MLAALLAVEWFYGSRIASAGWLAQGLRGAHRRGCIGVAVLLLILWFGVALIFRWQFQFSIRSLLALTVIVALPCSWLAVELKRAKGQRDAVTATQMAGGRLRYEYNFVTGGGITAGVPEPPGPAWLRDLLGTDFFTDCIYAEVSNDSQMEKLKGLTQLRWLHLWGTRITDSGLQNLAELAQLKLIHLERHPITAVDLLDRKAPYTPGDLYRVTDAGLECLKGLRKLNTVELNYTNVTDGGLKELQKALPNCKIER